MTTIYVLLLEEGKYYVGKTRNIEQRLKDHYDGKGSEWTKLYKTIEPVEIIEKCNDFDEDKYVLIYMSKYGIDNVRGGTYTNLILDESTIEHLNKMITSAKDRCFKCGEGGHFAKDCLSTRNNAKVYKRGYNLKCERCGKSNHNIDKCYSRTDKYGNLIGSTQRRLPPLSSISNSSKLNNSTENTLENSLETSTYEQSSSSSILQTNEEVTPESSEKVNTQIIATETSTEANNSQSTEVNTQAATNIVTVLDDGIFNDITDTGKRIINQCIIS